MNILRTMKTNVLWNVTQCTTALQHKRTDFHSCTAHLDIIKVFFIFTNRCTIYLLRSILKFTLKVTLKFFLHVLV